MLFADIEPYEGGMLEVGDGHRIAWEVSGRRDALQIAACPLRVWTT